MTIPFYSCLPCLSLLNRFRYLTQMPHVIHTFDMYSVVLDWLILWMMIQMIANPSPHSHSRLQKHRYPFHLITFSLSIAPYPFQSTRILAEMLSVSEYSFLVQLLIIAMIFTFFSTVTAVILPKLFPDPQPQVSEKAVFYIEEGIQGDEIV